MNLGEFLSPEAGQKRTKALNSTINEAMRYFLGPTGIDRRVQVANELVNPVVGISQASTHTKAALDPSKSGKERALAGGMALGEVLGVAAPVAAHKIAGKSADEIAGTMQDVLTGINATPSAVAGREFAGNESGAIRAFHGSPHDFDEFSMDKIGTGEGAQAYGHGLYFAENQNVAKDYRDGLSRAVNIGGRDVQYINAADEFDRSFQDLDLPSTVRDDARWYLNRGFTPEQFIDDLRNQDPVSAEKLAGVFKSSENPGRLYEVNIDANPEDFLDWDKPLSEQPEAVRRLADTADISSAAGPTRVRLSRYRVGEDDPNDPAIGQHLHRAISDYGDETASATELMRQAGIPGIKYLDQGSRGAGKGSSNYVVFDDKLVSIIKKYGIAGAAAMLGMSAEDLQAQAAQQEQPLGDYLNQ